ncbi:unnamed protein product, partial [Pylaiella littoralis]
MVDLCFSVLLRKFLSAFLIWLHEAAELLQLSAGIYDTYNVCFFFVTRVETSAVHNKPVSRYFNFSRYLYLSQIVSSVFFIPPPLPACAPTAYRGAPTLRFAFPS